MGLKDLEQITLIKLVLNLTVSIALFIWMAKRDNKTRYHQLLIYLTVNITILVLVGLSDPGSPGWDSLFRGILPPSGFSVWVGAFHPRILVKATIPSIFMVLALELYVESLFISQHYKVVKHLKRVNHFVALFALCNHPYHRFGRDNHPQVPRWHREKNFCS